jgi:NAD(P)-dependent dehydrogenase (short-subunit alcohol dehydrogenase family)|tara:strand:+ start:1945 stop:2787 length:843 start_codon:yes stop_codon:yes gene_type:complete
MARLENKVSLVVGGGQSLGEAIVRRFAAEGSRVVVADINEELANLVAERVRAAGGEAIAQQMDMTVAEDVSAAVLATVEAYGSLDVLVCNAAIFGAGKNFVEISEGEWENTIRVNLNGPFLCAKESALQMKVQESGGNIVFISSVSGVVGNEHQSDYNTSKHAVIGMMRCIAQDCRNWGIRSNAVCPTGMQDSAMMINHPLKGSPDIANYASLTAFSRFAYCDEVANAVLFVASDEASYMTGSLLMVDGGATAWQPSHAQLTEGAAHYLENFGTPGEIKS